MDKTDKTTGECCKEKMLFKRHCHHGGGHGDAIYGLGVVGALFYFLKGASTIGAVLVGIGKSIFWPAILMFKLLTYLRI
jgi:hypothetical protein